MDNRMENPRVVHENWSQIKEAIHRRFADLTESDLEETHGDLNDLEDLMAEKLGESRDEARSQIAEFLKPFQNAGATQGLTARDRDVPKQPPMISDGIKGDVQNLKDDLNAQHPLDGVPSGIQSGEKPADRESGDLDPLKPIDSSVHSGQNFSGQGDHTRKGPDRYEKTGDQADRLLNDDVGREPGGIDDFTTPSKTNY